MPACVADDIVGAVCLRRLPVRRFSRQFTMSLCHAYALNQQGTHL